MHPALRHSTLAPFLAAFTILRLCFRCRAPSRVRQTSASLDRDCSATCFCRLLIAVKSSSLRPYILLFSATALTKSATAVIDFLERERKRILAKRYPSST